MKWLRSLHLRLVATYLTLALLLLGATGLVFSRAFTTYAAQVQQQRRLEMIDQARRVAMESTAPAEETTRLLQEAFPDLTINLVYINGESAMPTTASATAVAARELVTQERTLPAPSLFLRIQRIEADPTASILMTSPLMSGVSIMISSQAKPAPVYSAFYREIALTLAVALALAGLIGWRFSGWLARPVARLSEATAAVAAGDFQQQVAPTGTLELDRLADQFNSMAVRLDESFRSLAAERDLARRFAADAAHELKTPLTALRTYYELAATSPNRTGQVMEPLGRQIDRLERIMTGLLQLARLSETTSIHLADGDGVEAVRSLVPGFRAMAEEYGHTLTLTVAEAAAPLPTRLDSRLLELILTNLVENACKFTPAGGAIRLESAAKQGHAEIRVTDNGPGISPEELPLIFERFHRGIHTQEIPGSGLGLSIAAEAARRLSGAIAVETEPGKGATFALRLPLKTPSEEA